MLKEFGPDIWTADGPEIIVAGFRYPTRMAAIRLSNDNLFIWSPVELTDALRSAIDGVGTVKYLVAPNSLHHLFLPSWKRAYPEATLCAAPGLRKKRKDIVFDGDIEDASICWREEIEYVVVHGNLITTEVAFFHSKSRTVLFCDLLQQMPASSLSGWRATVAALDLMTGPEPSVPRKFRVAFVNRASARRSLREIVAWPAEKVLMAHGTPVEADARAFLRRAFSWTAL